MSRASRSDEVGGGSAPRAAEWDWAATGRTGDTPRSRQRRLPLRLVLLAVVAAVLVGGALGLLRPKSYTATAQSFVSPAASSSGQSDPYAGSTFVLQRMQTYSEVATSQPVLSAVLSQVGAGMTLDGLAAEVTAQNPPRSVLLTVSVRDADPVRAASLANALSQQQARAVEALEGAGGDAAAAPVQVTAVSVADVPPHASVVALVARAAVPGLAAGVVVLLGGLVLLRRRRHGSPSAADFLTSIERRTA